MTENFNLAATIARLHKQWKAMNKAEIADNIEKYLYEKYPECQTSFDIKMEKLAEFTGAEKQTIYSWLNRSRERVKMPFHRVCQIAGALEADIEEILTTIN